MSRNQIIYGLHSVKAALSNPKRVNHELIIVENHKHILDKIRSNVRKVKILNQKEFKKIYGSDQTTQGIVLKTEDYERPTLEDFLKNENVNSESIIIILDKITDPQNIGSIMRSCALFNCRCIISSKDNAPNLTPSLLKAASGGAEIVNYYKVTNLRRCITTLKKMGYWIYGFESKKNRATNFNFENRSVLIFGSEGKGIRDLIKKECDMFIKLKMKSISDFEIDSLNVSNAASIALYEYYKQKFEK